jgi:protein ImuB
MPVAEARAVAGQFELHEEDPEADLRTLRQLAQWAERYSPLLGLEDEPAPQSLLVDITGCAACFHGEDNLLQRAVREFTQAGWVPRVAIADSVGAAWALAHFGRTPCLIPPRVGCVESSRSTSASRRLDAPYKLRDLPPAALRLPAKTLTDLAQLGIDRIGSLLDLPRNDIPARFGTEVLNRIDQALGRQPEVIVPNRTPEEIQASESFEYPTDRWEVLNYVVDRLTQQIHQQLQRRNLAARALENWFYHLSELPLRIEVGLYKPSNSSNYLAMLLHARLERARIKEPIRAVWLHVTATASLRDHQLDFLGEQEHHGIEEASHLVDCLSSRLGAQAVTRARLVEDYQPEHAYRFEPLIQPAVAMQPAQQNRPARAQRRSRRVGRVFEAHRQTVGLEDSAHPTSSCLVPPLRPLRLWDQPVRIEVVSAVPNGPPFQLRWAGHEYRILRSWGPERIATGWWRGQDIERDYYVAATDQGTRLWIFRSRHDGRWFLHGCFD